LAETHGAANGQPEEIQQYYDDIAEQYDESRFGTSYGAYIDQVESRFLSACGLGGSVLDVGCGTGRFLGTVTNAGVDFSPKMVEIARRKGLPVALADATDLPFDDASFDHVVIMHLLMHVPDVGSVLREASRVVKDGGSVVFDIPNKTRRRLTRFTPGGWHARNALTLGEVRTLCGRYGLRRDRIWGCMFFPAHRIPETLRRCLLPLECMIDRTPLKHLASYYVVQSSKNAQDGLESGVGPC